MSREFPLGSPRSRGNSDVVLPRQFVDALTAGVAVSVSDANSGHPIVKLFDGSAFAGFSVSDIDQVTKTTGVIKTGEAVCLRVKEDAILVVGEGFAVDNTTGELVPAGMDGSTTINGEVADIGVNGLDGVGEVIHGCALVNLYGGAITLTTSTQDPQLASIKPSTAKK
ncbi:hypothetical protein [Vibrio algivorus]|uniref:Uncharacterized protein n=1 Tax=Vibrio algivorus TaxID=1667024 RepID=A0ABQ6ELN0_9VIBR|nr:hypothetical protein [Vibrio algivorus]GLT13899.1 hypothetical protein GCM10007931_08730 [Vibrio algivorus]